jgi:hypothetical protein
MAQSSPKFDDFEDTLRTAVSRKMGISKEDVKYLHHPFHWEFFLKNQKREGEGYVSPFRYVQASNSEQSTKVKLTRNYDGLDIGSLVRLVLKNYRTLLEARVRKAFSWEG